MLRAARMLPFLAAVIVFLLIGQTGVAQGLDAAKDQLNDHATAATSTFSDALKGDSDAAMRLVIQYAVPAALALGVFFIGFLIASFIGRFVGNVVSKKVDLTLGRFLTKAVRNVLLLFLLLVALSKFGIDVTSFAAILAAAGFAIGMALQGTLSNFAAGVMLMVFRPFKVDDYIVINGGEGRVHEVDLFTTRLNTRDNRHLIIPNGQIFGSPIENFSHNDFRRVDVNVGASYDADLDITRKALERAAEKVPGAVTSPEPQIYLVGLGASSVDWQLRVWCRPKDYWTVKEFLTADAKRFLDRANVGIPYPQMDVHVVGKVLAKAA